MTTAEMGDALEAVPLAAPAVSVTTSHGHGCAMLIDGRVQCWGASPGGVLSVPETLDPPPGVTVIAVTTGQYSTCLQAESGAVYCTPVGAFEDAVFARVPVAWTGP